MPSTKTVDKKIQSRATTTSGNSISISKRKKENMYGVAAIAVAAAAPLTLPISSIKRLDMSGMNRPVNILYVVLSVQELPKIIVQDADLPTHGNAGLQLGAAWASQSLGITRNTMATLSSTSWGGRISLKANLLRLMNLF